MKVDKRERWIERKQLAVREEDKERKTGWRDDGMREKREAEEGEV